MLIILKCELEVVAKQMVGEIRKTVEEERKAHLFNVVNRESYLPLC